MSNAVESMMYVGNVPWHGLGTSVVKEARAADALQLAGLNWNVELQPVFVGSGLVQQKVERAKATVRVSDQKPLGVVGDRYVPVQNPDAFSFFDAVVGAGQAIYHTAGALDGGRKIWILAKLPGHVRLLGDDITEKFLLLANSHDGTAALRMLFTPIRVVCQNTLNVALRMGVGEGSAIRHTANATARLDEARRALGFATSFYDDFECEAQRLVRATFSEQQVRKMATAILPSSGVDVSSRIQNQRDRILDLFETGRGHSTIRGTAWAALNAVAEYADHHRAARGNGASAGEKRLGSIWFGSGATLKQSAYRFINTELAAA
jgi:phage/plasmid-like protein (TIGR03299 family)